ncbi:MAG: insulinase family protein [Armatimonadetes bacterium]|nr:insulinase family protein [Armatimonadota bacterium]
MRDKRRRGVRLVILAFALLLAQANVPRILEVPNANATYVHVECVACFPADFQPEEGGAMPLLCQLLRDSATRTSLRRYTSRFAVRAGLDNLRISFNCALVNIEAANHALASVLRQRQFTDDQIDAARQELSGFGEPAYKRLLWPKLTGGADTELLQNLTDRLCNSGSVVICYSGAIPSGTMTPIWRRDPYGLLPPADSGLHPFQRSLESRFFAGQKIPAFISKPASKFSPAMLVAAACLGSGKGSLAFQVLREKLGAAYTPEAGLIGNPAGFRLGVLMEGLSVEQRAALGRAAQELKEQDVARAKAMLTSSMKWGLDLFPLFTGFDHCVQPASLEGSTFLYAYWAAKNGEIWDPNLMLKLVEGVKLAEVKIALQALLGSPSSAPRSEP